MREFSPQHEGVAAAEAAAQELQKVRQQLDEQRRKLDQQLAKQKKGTVMKYNEYAVFLICLI